MKKFAMSAILFALANLAFGQVPVVNIYDSRRAARALASQKPTEWFAGYIACDLLQSDGTKIWADYRFKAKYYPVGFDFVLKPYYFSKSVDHVLYDDEAKPLEVIPYPIDGTPINLYAYLSGYDADGYATMEGELNSATWISRQPFIFKTRPGRQPVFVTFDLEGRPPESVGLVMEEWGPYPYDYNVQRGGFWLWIDPMTVYHYTIVDRTNHNAIIIPRTELDYGSLPVLPPAGSSLNMKMIDGVQVVKFNADGFYQPAEVRYESTVPIDNLGPFPAAVFAIDRAETLGQILSFGFGNFTGQVQVELVYEGGSHQTILDFTWSYPDNWRNDIVIPTAGAAGVVISFIQDSSISVPTTTSSTDFMSRMYLTIVRPNALGDEPTSGGGGGVGKGQ